MTAPSSLEVPGPETEPPAEPRAGHGARPGGGSSAHAHGSILAALAANLAVAAIKLVAFFFTGSSAMLAESAHSIADTVNEILLLTGARYAEAPSSEAHPFGHGHDRYITSFLVALVIFLVGGIFALHEGLEKVHEPKVMERPAWAIGVLLAAMAFEGLSLRTAIKASAKARHGRSLPRFVRETKSPELLVVILEDAGALVGLLLALVGVTATLLTGNGLYDALASVGIGVLMVLVSLVLARETRSLLLGEAAHPVVVRAIAAAIPDGGLLRSVIHLRTQHLGPDELLVAAKVAVDPDATARALVDALSAAEARIRAATTYLCLIYLEPDLRR